MYIYIYMPSSTGISTDGSYDEFPIVAIGRLLVYHGNYGKTVVNMTYSCGKSYPYPVEETPISLWQLYNYW